MPGPKGMRVSVEFITAVSMVTVSCSPHCLHRDKRVIRVILALMVLMEVLDFQAKRWSNVRCSVQLMCNHQSKHRVHQDEKEPRGHKG